MEPNPDVLTPGVIDGHAKRAFSFGACGGLAIALHDATGWPIIAITDAHNVMHRRRNTPRPVTRDELIKAVATSSALATGESSRAIEERLRNRPLPPGLRLA